MENPEHYKTDNKVFGTLEEANAYASDYARKTRIILAVEATRRKITHKYNLGVTEK
jgi:hypothetical protein